MTAATRRVDQVKPYGLGPIAATIKQNLQAALAPYKFWLMARNTSGIGVAVTAVPNLIPLGAAEQDIPSPGGTSDSDASVVCRGSFFTGYNNSSLSAGDTFADADFGKVAWGVDNQTIGKLSNLSGNNRSMVGLFVGMGESETSTATLETRFWGGVSGWIAARTAHIADRASPFRFVYPVDAGAGTALTETVIPRDQLHGTVTSFRYTPSATLAADATNYKTITISKRTAALPGTAVVVATLTSVLGFTAYTPVLFTLSAVAGVLDLLEDDVLTIKNAATASGAVVPVGAVDGTMKVG